MDGYQPKKTCDNCLAFNICKYAVNGQAACRKYKECRPAPPKTGSNVQTPTYTPPPMPEVKPPKQRTVLSVRDFAILLRIAEMHIDNMEHNAKCVYMFNKMTPEDQQKEMDKNMKQLQSNPLYQDLLRIRAKLGELNIEVETPSVEVEYENRI